MRPMRIGMRSGARPAFPASRMATGSGRPLAGFQFAWAAKGATRRSSSPCSKRVRQGALTVRKISLDAGLVRPAPPASMISTNGSAAAGLTGMSGGSAGAPVALTALGFLI